jgi:hypothetical protein
MRIDVLPGEDVQPNDLLRGKYDGPLPLTAVVKQAGPQGDLLGTFWANIYAITPGLLELLTRLAITGWGALPISLTGGPSGGGLSLLTVTGRSGPIIGAGGIDMPGVDRIGQYLDASNWDGSDIFLPANSRSILVVPDAAKAVEARHPKDLQFDLAGLEPLVI